MNVLGSLLGPLVAGFWLLPAMGERSALLVLSLPLFVMGLVGVVRPAVVMGPNAVAMGTRTAGLLFAGVVVASVLVTVASKSWEEVLLRPSDEARRDHTATAIAATSPNGKVLVINGRPHAYSTTVTKTMAHLPLASLERPPDHALVVAFGMGTTFRSLLSWNIDTTAVELVPSVPALFGQFHRNAVQLLASPRAHVVIDDGRRFLDRSTDLYDVITIDPPLRDRESAPAPGRCSAAMAPVYGIADPGVGEPGDPRFVSTRPRISLSAGRGLGVSLPREHAADPPRVRRGAGVAASAVGRCRLSRMGTGTDGRASVRLDSGGGKADLGPHRARSRRPRRSGRPSVQRVLLPPAMGVPLT